MKNRMKMQARYLDRVLWVWFSILVLIPTAIAISFGFQRAWAVLAVYLVLFIPSLKWGPIGHWAQYTLGGDRKNYFVNEGAYIVPWFLGFGHIRRDCRVKVNKLEKTTAITKDGVEIEIEDI